MKEFLTEYKIFFETIASTMIAIMAVVVSIVALNISSKANQISASSLNISRLALLPKVSAEFRFNSAENGKRSETLVISNSGDVMYDFHSYPFAFLRLNELKLVTSENSEKTVFLQSVVVPILHYFPVSSYITDVNKGIISEQHIIDTNRLAPILNQFSQGYNEESKSIGGAIQRYLFVSYVDQFGETHEKYMRFEPFGTSVPLTKEEGEKLLALHQQVKTRDALVLDYEHATLDKLQSIWDESNKKVIAVK
ncbi:TPA: hypothetical protein RQL13_004492 [Vibrio vulnificus]|nr:hypothetical protein [Vibrio vulnificus]HAS6253663.1 hypothetical protein [Vibrio vulnificus]HAS6299836.1 hypothetical protein [Vibrio vulnificus]HDY7434108.1 hypothetical protein [Vibrio vulnificus]HDY7572126.1 hypothetical protein [Vibrio vulnificus]